MSTIVRLRLRIVLLLAVALAAGCGLAPEHEPVRVPASPVDETSLRAPQSTGVVQIYLVRDGRLVAVPRTGLSVSDAILALAAGPTSLDGEAGLGSVLPADLVEPAVAQDSGIVTVEVTPEFAALSGREQYLAVAQLVWTATDACCATQVRVQLGARPLSLPTDSGPVQRPVRRADYRAVAPR
jgi:hypothetical protein